MFTSCADSLVRYANHLKKSRNVTNQIIADTAMVPAGTVGRFMAGSAKNTSTDTVIKILSALDADFNVVVRIMAAGSSGISDEDLAALLRESSQQQPAPARDPRPDTAADVAADTVSSLAETFNELARRKDEQHLSAIDSIERTHQADVERLARVYEQDLRRQQRIIVILAAALGVVALAVFALLFVDILHPSIGWIRAEWP